MKKENRSPEGIEPQARVLPSAGNRSYAGVVSGYCCECFLRVHAGCMADVS